MFLIGQRLQRADQWSSVAAFGATVIFGLLSVYFAVRRARTPLAPAAAAEPGPAGTEGGRDINVSGGNVAYAENGPQANHFHSPPGRAHGFTDEQRCLLRGAHKVLCNALRGEHEHFDHLRAAPRDVSGDVTADMTIREATVGALDRYLKTLAKTHHSAAQRCKAPCCRCSAWQSATVHSQSTRSATSAGCRDHARSSSP
ncbi:hypothetical protein [Actinoplanes sp. GCM10030250]|uniref:hypothetical protein n=1 Tax=Actinoplanes sp. GCM10030250 TaxID=3273376 RepID=UPI00360FA3FC